MASNVTRNSGGPRVKKLQKAANGHLTRRKFEWRRIEVDGEPGNATFDAVHMAAWLLGFSEDQLRRIHKGVVTPHTFDIIIGQKERTDVMQKRDRERRDEAKKLRKLHKEKGTIQAVQVTTTSGAPHYGGAADVMNQLVKPLIVGEFGLPVGSEKRTPSHNAAIGGSPTSDHLTTKSLTFATDFPTFSGETAARALAKKVGWTNWSPNSYATFDVKIDGHTYRFQILWGSGIGHGDHIHVGISLV